MGTKQTRALANYDQPADTLMRELTAYVQTYVDPDARLVVNAVPIPNEPPDTSQRPHRTWFLATYEAY